MLFVTYLRASVLSDYTPEGKKAEEGARKRGLTLHAWLVMRMLAAKSKFAVRVCIVGAGTESAGEDHLRKRS